jgi:hypothetical protein
MSQNDAVMPGPQSAGIRHRSKAEWFLFALAIEKVVQHVFVTWAFAANRFELRDRVAAPYEVLMFVGGAAAVCFALAGFGLWRRQRRSCWILIGLALVDIVGEFVAQGTIMIEVNVSFVVALAILGLAIRQLRRSAHT